MTDLKYVQAKDILVGDLIVVNNEIFQVSGAKTHPRDDEVGEVALGFHRVNTPTKIRGLVASTTQPFRFVGHHADEKASE